MYKKIMSWIILLGGIAGVVGLLISFFSEPGNRFGHICGEAGFWSLIVAACCFGWMAYDSEK